MFLPFRNYKICCLFLSFFFPFCTLCVLFSHFYFSLFPSSPCVRYIYSLFWLSLVVVRYEKVPGKISCAQKRIPWEQHVNHIFFSSLKSDELDKKNFFEMKETPTITATAAAFERKKLYPTKSPKFCDIGKTVTKSEHDTMNTRIMLFCIQTKGKLYTPSYFSQVKSVY